MKKCKDCKWWSFDNEKMLSEKNDLFGECNNGQIVDLAGTEGGSDTLAGYDRFFVTKPDFGCTLFEPKL
jgi:hypothetical protein